MPKSTTSWKKGISGNPKGRPKKGDSIAELLSNHLDIKSKELGKTYKESIVHVLTDKAIKGDLGAIKLIMHYHDGLPARGTLIERDIQNEILVTFLSPDYKET